MKVFKKCSLGFLSKRRLIAALCIFYLVGIEGDVFSASYESEQTSPVAALGALAASNGPLPQAADFQPRVQGQGANLYTGDMNLNIPLFVLPGRGGLNYPIGLSYQAGIKLDQEASWVGLGWNLTPGAVTRNVINYPDDYAPAKTEIKLDIEGEEFSRNCGGFLYTGTHTHSDFENKFDYKIDKGSFNFGGKSGLGDKKIYGYGRLYVSDPSYTPDTISTDGSYYEQDHVTSWGDGNYERFGANYVDVCYSIWVKGGYHAGYAHIEMALKSKKPYAEIYPCDGKNPDIYSLNGERLILTANRKFHLQKTEGQTSSDPTIADAVKIEYGTDSVTGTIKYGSSPN